jgi:hypothetical protein
VKAFEDENGGRDMGKSRRTFGVLVEREECMPLFASLLDQDGLGIP